MKSLQADFFKVMKEGAIQYAAPLPFLDLVCVGTATQTEVEEQVDLMYSLIHQQVDAIVLVPIDSKALVQPVVEAVRKGVPVINIDIRLDTQLLEQAGIIRKSKFPQNPKRSVRFSGKGTKRSVQKRKARNTQKAETKVL